MKNLVLFGTIAVLLMGCNVHEPVEDAEESVDIGVVIEEKEGQSNETVDLGVVIEEEVEDKEDKEEEVLDLGIVVEDGENRVVVESKGVKYSFIAFEEGFDYTFLEDYGHFRYEGLEFALEYGGPYAIYKDVDYEKIKYVCDGSLIYSSDGSSLPYEYCETDGEKSLDQFEYSAAGGVVFSTGGGYSERWNKIYIRRVHGKNYVFSGVLEGGFLPVDAGPHEIEEVYNELLALALIAEMDLEDEQAAMDKIAEVLSSKAYLDEIMKSDENQRRIAVWDEYVDSFEVLGE